ncbi:uncharacterized protein LOC125570223 [Nematostella vectensis]|uniref:uncharacterized protein LOC125570223 n=1 Tax=Nematostella vectensis TaxID=45351 RepID=UPI00207753D0|nr:uncharacterized protein LOC125570223 [Nematostella vectensis]
MAFVNLFVLCVLPILFAAQSVLAAPLSLVGDSLDTRYHFLKADCFTLIKFVGETKNDFVAHRFQSVNYDHYYHFNGVDPVTDFYKIPEKVFLEKQTTLLFSLRSMIEQIVKNEATLPVADNFKDRFQQIQVEIEHMIAVLQQMEKSQNYPVTKPSNSPQPTPKPSSTPKEMEEWKLGTIKELFLSLIYMQAGINYQLSN